MDTYYSTPPTILFGTELGEKSKWYKNQKQKTKTVIIQNQNFICF